MGANTSQKVKSITEGKKFLKKQILGAYGCGLSPDGDFCILNPATSEVHIFEPILEAEGCVIKKIDLKEKKSSANIKPNTILIAKFFGERPTKNKPFIAMGRFN